MRLIKQDIDTSDGSGSATLLPEEPEDIVDNLLHQGSSVADCGDSGTRTTSYDLATSCALLPSAK